MIVVDVVMYHGNGKEDERKEVSFIHCVIQGEKWSSRTSIIV